MRRTKILTIEDYPIIYNRQAELLKQVNLEAEILYPKETPALPKFEKPPKQPLSVGIYNFIKSGVMACRP